MKFFLLIQLLPKHIMLKNIVLFKKKLFKYKKNSVVWHIRKSSIYLQIAFSYTGKLAITVHYIMKGLTIACNIKNG
jgi:hypothetical protein